MKPHRTDGVSLSFGVLFLLVALWWAVSRVVNVHLPAVGWLVAGGLILFGVIGLMGAIRSGRRAPEPVHVTSTTTAPAPPVETPGDLPPEMHASIVRELLDDPADRFQREHPDSKRD
jgi:Na+-transporting methylmalonyl-CoA/oxaloacetate decarboxylase gamma subunit